MFQYLETKMYDDLLTRRSPDPVHSCPDFIFFPWTKCPIDDDLKPERIEKFDKYWKMLRINLFDLWHSEIDHPF